MCIYAKCQIIRVRVRVRTRVMRSQVINNHTKEFLVILSRNPYLTDLSISYKKKLQLLHSNS